MNDITVLKRNLNGEVTWQYEGRILERKSNSVVLEAFFNRDDMPFMDVVLKRDDRFVERFYSDRWYNVFGIYDRDDGKFKGWLVLQRGLSGGAGKGYGLLHRFGA